MPPANIVATMEHFAPVDEDFRISPVAIPVLHQLTVDDEIEHHFNKSAWLRALLYGLLLQKVNRTQ